MIEYKNLINKLKKINDEIKNNKNNRITLLKLKMEIKKIQKKLKKLNKEILESKTINTEDLLNFLRNVLNSYGKHYSLNKAISKPKDKEGEEEYFFICDNNDHITKQYIQENIGFEGLTSIPFENAVVLKDEKTTIVDKQLNLKSIFKENPIIENALEQLMKLIENNEKTPITELMKQVIEKIEKEKNKGRRR